jgi:hypothetical protein
MKKIVFMLVGALIMLAIPTTGFLPAQNRPPVHWVNGGQPVAVKQGDTFDFQAQFYSDVAIPNAWWGMPGRIGVVMASNHSADSGRVFIGDVEPNRIYSIRLQVPVPQDLPTGQYPGNLIIFNMAKQAGSSAGSSQFPEYLRVMVYVMDANP